MNKKKLLLIIAAVVALCSLVVGIFLILPKQETPQPEPSQTSGEISLDPTTNQDDYFKELDKLKDSEEMKVAIDKYSGYINRDASNLGSFNPDLVLPVAWGASKYIEEGFFNPYFVSGYWEKKDSYKADAINKYLAPYMSESLKNEYAETIKTPESIPAYFNDKVYMPDSSMIVPESCAEDWVQEACFRIPSTIDSITYQGVSEKNAIVTVDFTMNTNYQNPTGRDGVLTDQQRKYTLTFDVLFDNATMKDLSFNDVKIQKVSGSFSTTNTDDSNDQSFG